MNIYVNVRSRHVGINRLDVIFTHVFKVNDTLYLMFFYKSVSGMDSVGWFKGSDMSMVALIGDTA